MSDNPRDPSGEPLCVWCGGEIKQSGIGRRKDYCSRTHREYAYRARREAAIRLQGYTKGRADERIVSSTVETPHQRDTSVDEMKPTGQRLVSSDVPSVPTERVVPPPLPPRPRSGRRRSNMAAMAMPLPLGDEEPESP